MTTTVVTLSTDQRGCWCAATRRLVGQVILDPDDDTPRMVSGTEHRTGAAGSLCGLLLDGVRLHHMPRRTGPATANLTVTDTRPPVLDRLATPTVLTGEVTLTEALRAVQDVQARVALATDALPVATSGPHSTARTERLDRISRIPTGDETVVGLASGYTRGRVRETPGGFAADIGHGGSIRTVGEHPTREDAAAAIVAGLATRRADLEGWLSRHVTGDWTISWPPITISGT